MNSIDAIKEFENMKLNAELKALQKISLERELNDTEFHKFHTLANMKLAGEI